MDHILVVYRLDTGWEEARFTEDEFDEWEKMGLTGEFGEFWDRDDYGVRLEPC